MGDVVQAAQEQAEQGEAMMGTGASAPPLVAVVEDSVILAETLCAALEAEGIPATAVPVTEPGDLLPRITALPARLVLLDLDLGPGGDGVQLVAPLVAAGRTVLVLTGSADPMRIAAALERGAIGHLVKGTGFEQVLRTTLRALEATGPLDPAVRTSLLCELARTRRRRQEELAPFRRLTERETEVLVAMGHGRSAQQIATSWVVAEATVRTHIRGVLTKLGARSQLEAVALAWLVGVMPAGGLPNGGVSPLGLT